MGNAEMPVKSSDVKIGQALELLNEAAKEKRDEVKDLLAHKYAHIRDAILEGTEQGKQVIEKAQKFVKETASETDKRVRENPWPYIAGAAVISVFVGYLMGCKRK